MFRNYLKIAFRNLLKHKLFAVINISGLALSMSICLMVILVTKEELAIDSFNPAPSHIYRITSKVSNPAGQTWRLASTPLPLGATLSRDSSLVARSVTIYPAINGRASVQNKEMELHAAFTGPNLFNIFGFHLLSGNAANALLLPNSIVLHEAVAEKYFGKQPALGQTINITGLGAFQITGVIAKTPSKSHIQFDAFVSESSVPLLEKNKLLPEKQQQWNTYENAYTYVQLKENVGEAALQSTLNRLTAGFNQDPKQGSLQFITQPFSNITPGSDDLYNDISRGATWGKLLGPVGIALIILIAACFNYTNLSIVRSLGRAKEVGIRKVSGAKRSQIFIQYILEAMLISLIALILGYVLLIFLSQAEVFNQDEVLMPFVSANLPLFAIFIVFSLFTGLLAGSLPAWILSSFKPAEVLKNISLNKLFGNINLRKSLIAFQLVLSLVVSIFLLSFYRQFAYLSSSANYEERTQHIASIPLQGVDPALLQSELASLGSIKNMALVSANIGKKIPQNINIQNTQLNYISASPSFIPMMKLQLAAGNNMQQATDALINEKAVTALGFKSNAAAIGQVLQVNDSTRLQIAGVLKDFTYENVGRNLAPLLLSYDTAQMNTLLVYTDQPKAPMQIGGIWHKLYPQKAFEYNWLYDEISQGNSQRSSVSLLSYLAFMTIVIAGLGLLALVIYTTETRRKEIGIRKIMGAGVNNLIWLLSGSFVKLVIISGIIAFPIGYALSTLFLQNFANRVSVGAGSFALCLALLLVIALLAIISQTWKAAGANPANTLKND